MRIVSNLCNLALKPNGLNCFALALIPSPIKEKEARGLLID